jgi:hypothetical protein
MEKQEPFTIDVNYPTKTHGALNNAHDVQVSDSAPGGLQGNEQAVLQSYDGTVSSTSTIAQAGSTAFNVDIAQPANTAISVVQLVVVDSNGNIVEVRGAWVTTQADLNNRASQIQQGLLTTTDPAQITALQTEASAIQSALLTAPLSENLPALP